MEGHQGCTRGVPSQAKKKVCESLRVQEIKIPSADLVRRVSDIEDELDLRVINSDRRGTSSVTTRGATNMVRERWSKPNLKSR